MQPPFVVGLALGIGLGGAGTYLALAQPWGGADAVVIEVAMDAAPGGEDQVTNKRRKKGRKGGKRKRGEALQEIDERVLPTDADRRMVWRGPQIALPESSVDFASGRDARSLDQSEINEGVGSRQDKLSSCIAEARGQAELAAGITLKFLVSDAGAVTKVRIHAPSYLLKHGLYECAASVTRNMRFPNTGKATVVTVPLELSY